jgi:hypothetical protein
MPSIGSPARWVVADILRRADDRGQKEVFMTTRRDARLDILLSAICAMAVSLPPKVREHAGAVLRENVVGMCPLDQASDIVIARDLALILGALGSMPSDACKS